jgi:PD-(D/E)XK endonuclease
MDRGSGHRRESQRLINRRQQGDLGEASAIEWLTRHGARVWTPLGYSPDADLVAEIAGQLLRVQVKTTTLRALTPNGHERWEVSLATNGGNQSWSRVSKTFNPSRFDALYVLTGGGRRWWIPADAIESTHGINLGGRKHSEFEIEPAHPIDSVVYDDTQALLECDSPVGEYPSGQRMRAVNASAYAFAGSNPASPISASSSTRGLSVPGEETPRPHESLGRSGQVIIRRKRQTTIPKQPYVEAGLKIDDRMRVRASGAGRLVFERIEEA